METGQQSPAAGQCPGCGHSLDAHAVYCPNCGRPNLAMTAPTSQAIPATSQDALYATTPVQTTDATTPPPLPAWYDQPTATGGISGLAVGPAVTPEQPIRSHKRRNILTAISAIVVIVLIGSGAYWAYAALASRTDNQLARYFPSSTVVFASADLVAAANNNFHINPTDVASGQQTDMLQKATGLDWKNDVLPWVGRNVAVGVFPLANAQQAAANPAAAIGVTALIQSRDDNAAKAAITKLTGHLKQQGTAIQQSTYNNFTVYTVGSGTASGLIANGNGWVLVASNAEAAHVVIDRINNGSNNSLNDQQAFKDATSNAPSNTFGTYYLNLRQLLTTVSPVQAPNGLGGISVPFIETYPVAGGYLAWNNNGERSQITFNAVRNPNIPDVSGDTTGFASLAPSDAVAYIGAANLGKLTQAAIAQFGSLPAGADPVQSALGISASDPLAQQPIGMAAINTNDRGVQPVFYVHVNDDAAATQVVNKLASKNNWTAKPTTIAGKSATALYSSAPDFGPVPPVPPTNGGAVTATARIAAVALTLNNTLVIAPDTNSATLVAQVAQGSVSNLTSNATFQKMIKAAPSGAAVTGYFNAATLEKMVGAAAGSQLATTSFAHLDAIAFTLVWNNSALQGTFDTALHS